MAKARRIQWSDDGDEPSAESLIEQAKKLGSEPATAEDEALIRRLMGQGDPDEDDERLRKN